LAYNIVFKESSEKDLKAIDRAQAKKILNAIEKKLSTEPRKHGEPLHGEWDGFWKLYVKPYRVIFEIFENDSTVRVYRIGHRKDVYR